MLTKLLTGGSYTVLVEGALAYFYDDTLLLFSVPASVAKTQLDRDTLASAYDAGIADGITQGKKQLQDQLSELLGLNK